MIDSLVQRNPCKCTAIAVSAKFCAYVVYTLEPIACQSIALISVSTWPKFSVLVEHDAVHFVSFFNMDFAIVQMGLRFSKPTLLPIFVCCVGKTVGCSLWFALLTWLLPLYRC